MKLASILREELIFVGVPGSCREEIYGELLKRASAAIDIPVTGALNALIEREDSSGMPYEGVAFPHTRMPELDDLYIIVGVLAEPAKLKENDAAATSIVVLSLISHTTSDVYLKSLAAFARYFSQPGKCAALAASPTPRAFFKHIEDDKVTLKKTITAEDLMSRDLHTVRPSDPLSKALDYFDLDQSEVLAVVDDDGRLVGELKAVEVIRHFVPEYIFMMDSLKFLTSFEAFDNIFQKENVETVGKFMQPPTMVTHPELPLIQFTVSLVRPEAEMIFVVDKENKLVGELSIHNVIHNVLRG